MDQIHGIKTRRAPVSTMRRASRLLCLICAGFVASLERSRQRRALARLSDSNLRDIGLTRREAEAEIGKPFWRR